MFNRLAIFSVILRAVAEGALPAACAISPDPLFITPTTSSMFCISEKPKGESSMMTVQAEIKPPNVVLQTVKQLPDCIEASSNVKPGVVFAQSNVTVNLSEGNRTVAQCSVTVITINRDSIARRIFNVVVIVLAVSISLMMGFMLDLKIVLSVLRRPLCPIIGFIAQFGLMPMIAFTLTKAFKFKPAEGMGLFVVGCSPGGSNSNQWTLIFDGDLDVSAVMTMMNTLFSFVMMPTWLYTIGVRYTREMSLHLPFMVLARNLSMIVGSYITGCTVSTFLPKTRQCVHTVIKPVFVFVMILFLTFGVYVNLPYFRLLHLRQALTAPLLPWTGFILGAFLATLCGLPWEQVKTVAIETGFQNIGVALLIVQTSFPLQECTMATVIIIIVSVLTALPLWLTLLCRTVYRRCTGEYTQVPTTGGDSRIDKAGQIYS